MKLINPATNQTIREIEEDTKSQITEKYQRALQAQPQWARIPLDHRLGIMDKFRELLLQEVTPLAKDLSQEMGKPVPEAVNEIKGACKRISFFIGEAKKWLDLKEVNIDGNTQEVLAHDPLGVIANISAWNYPYLVGVNVFIPALLAGNAVLYKPSEFATLTGLHIARLLYQAGVPKDVFHCVVGAKDAGECLLELPLAGYFFTGSYKTGQYIAERVAPKLVPVGLELGGKDPLYVTDDVANLDQVAEAVVEGCFYNNGQSCCAVERVYVHEKVYDSFIELMTEKTKKLNVGDPALEGINQGAITRSVHLDFLDSQIKDATAKGAKVLVGGERIKTSGSYFSPTLLTNVNHQMNLMTEESFGPIRGIMKVSSDEEAIKLMNDTEYGLTASVYSANIERAKKILEQVDTGTAYINCCDRVSPYLPWSGRKNSGLGSTLSFHGILAFTKPRGWHIRK